MKNNLLFMVFLSLLFLASSCSLPNAASGFYHDHKRKKGVRNFAVPGWLIYTATGFANDIVKEEEVQAALHLAKKVKKMQFMFDEGAGAISKTDVRHFQQHLRGRNFEDLIYVRAEDATVSFMVRSKKDKLRDLIVLVHADEDFVFLNMRTNIKIKHLAKLIDTIIQLDNKKKEEPTPKSPKKEEDKPIVRPRA